MEIATQVHTVDESTCKRVFGNKVRPLDECQAIKEAIFDIS